MKPNLNKINMITNKAGKKQVCFPCGLTFNSLDELMEHEDKIHSDNSITKGLNDTTT